MSGSVEATSLDPFAKSSRWSARESWNNDETLIYTSEPNGTFKSSYAFNTALDGLIRHDDRALGRAESIIRETLYLIEGARCSPGPSAGPVCSVLDSK
jgi:hypothetical protein